MSVATDSVVPALIAAVCLPVIGARLAGLHDSNRLALIAGYAFTGWGLAYLLAPQVAGIRSVRLSLVDIEPACILGSTVSTLVSLVGAAFAPRNLLQTLTKWNYAQAALFCIALGLSLAAAAIYLNNLPERELKLWLQAVETQMEAGADNPPPSVKVKAWNRMIRSTEDALFNCFQTPDDIVDHRWFHEFNHELRSQLAIPLSIDTLQWIWDEIEVVSKRGKSYSAKHRPTMLENQD